MKKFTMIIALVLMMAMPMLAEHISPETARIVATTFLDNNGAKSIELTDLSEEAGFPNLYIFTADDCFVVMSADNCVKPILGYSLTGNFVVEEMPEGVHCWLQGYNDQIQYAIEHQTKASPETAGQWKALAEGKAGAAQTTTIVGPLIQTKWNQIDPYNNQCPLIGNTRAAAGCVATAMAQIMKYWNHPTTGMNSHSYRWGNKTLSADFGNTDYDWSNMPNTLNSSSTPAQKTAVGTLMYHCGISINMAYNTGSSNAASIQVMWALQDYFKYAPNMQFKIKDEYSDSLWIAMLKTELNELRPMLYRGDNINGGPGHSFVCDGYDSDDNFHFNWGWSGSCDGYYSVDYLAPSTPDSTPTQGIFTKEESAIFGIEPVNSSLPAPTLSSSINKNAITLTWNAIESATSYDVYKDNKKIKSTTSTTYKDSKTEFGIYYDYYVRAVFPQNTRSNPSNHIIKCPLYRDIKPSNLTANFDNDNTITLTWTGYSGGQSTDLHYGTAMSYYECGTAATEDAYWGQRYPKAMLSKLKGMSITKITACFYYTGSYAMYLYSGDLDESTRIKLAEQTFTIDTARVMWKEFDFNPSIDIDCSKDLWVVFFADKSTSQPILYAKDYNQDDANDAKYISSTLNGLFSSGSIATGDISWLIRTYVSDGTYSYNLYDGNTKVNGNEPISGTSYTVNNIPNNAALQYTVKTNYNQGESEASNMMGFIVGNAELKSLILNANDKMTLTEGSKLTVIKTLNSPSIDNLVLENGAQLFTNSKNVQASVKKSIMGHKEDKGGWNFIASPIDEELLPQKCDGIYGEYDLYRFNQSVDGKEWQNYKNEEHTSNFVFESGQGYLYANDKNVNLSFAGPLYDGNGSFALAYDDGNPLAGWNIVGNPFPCNAYIIDMLFYIIKDKQLVPYIGRDPIPPCTGVMVHADGQGQTANFKRIDPNGVITSDFQPNQLHITVMQNVTNRDGVSTTSVEDNAIVSFNEGCQLEKFVFDINASRIYIPKNGRDYAIVTFEGQGEIPVNFQAAENGSYTFTVQPEGVEMNYLHLIDNLTGNEVDLLATPDYTFTAKTTDYPSRFRLLFSVLGNEDDNEANNFAYYSDGEIRVVEICDDASLQIVDMMGRVVLVNTDVACNVSTNGMTPGVYVLRLISGNNVKTQKIMVY